MKRKRTTAEEYAWVGTVVQFVCGALVGTLGGVFAWAEVVGSDWGWLLIPGGALLGGALAAIFGDEFWEKWLWI